MLVLTEDRLALLFHFFFFQAESGIRYLIVTGVQTCALPIDRKSKRLNSSHDQISYAVFCLETNGTLARITYTARQHFVTRGPSIAGPRPHSRPRAVRHPNATTHQPQHVT